MEPIEALKVFIKEIDKYEPLSKEQESALFDKIDAGKAAINDMNYCEGHELDPEYQDRIIANKMAIVEAEKAKQKIILSNQKFIYAIAKRKAQDEIVMDLIQEGNLGMDEAFGNYDRTKGTRFTTHASYYIERNMTNFLNNTRLLIKRPNNIISNNKVMAFEDKFLAENGRLPGQEETFEAMLESGIYFPKKEDMYGISFCPIQRQRQENDGDPCEDDVEVQPIEYINITADTNEYEDIADEEHTKSIVNDLLSVLTDKERRVIEMSYGIDSNDDEMTNKEIAKKLGLSSERIRQIKNIAMEKIKKEAQNVSY
jgi:RNA polymerase primary sigma factor